jgi:outer membrane protein OmpA-like peptidoglycan-associated protein
MAINLNKDNENYSNQNSGNEEKKSSSINLGKTPATSSINLGKSEGEKKISPNLSKEPAKDKLESSSVNSDTSNQKKSSKAIWLLPLIGLAGGVIWYATSKKSDVSENTAQANIELSAPSDSVGSSVNSTDTTTAADNPDQNTNSSSNLPADNAIESNNTQNASSSPQTTTAAVQSKSNKVDQKPLVTSTTSPNTASNRLPINNTKTIFAPGSSNINKVSSVLIKEISDYISKNPNSKVTINGYASSEGDLNFNQKLSQARADKLMSFLIRKGIPSGRLEAVGRGIENPIGDNSTLEGRVQNRRTEVVYQ